MDSNGVRRRDTTKGPPLRVLSLDGGGVRGYSMLIILQEIMYRTYVEIEGKAPRRDQIPKPADHFDLIVGTGTGGLIALMLGRLRLDIETCKELYVRLTRFVFETDKTIAGIPYRSTLFKASKLEEAIMEAVREHTVSRLEGNDGVEPEMSNTTPRSSMSNPRRHSSNASTVSFSARSPQNQMAQRPYLHPRYGNSQARLYDRRENRTKTAITAMYQGSRKGTSAALLRSYDSRAEPPPEFDCKIWEAGRATCAIGLAFKPIRIGQSVFHDDGVGTFNPAPEVLDEVASEWPGREVGVFVSIGTGKRPKSSDANQTMWYEGFLGDFAEARRRLISKIEGCELIHEYMIREHLGKRGVNIENYYRLNVEIGVGEFGMNEWHRLAQISTGTKQYLRRNQEHQMVIGTAAKLAKIHYANKRFERASGALPDLPRPASPPPPLAVELPAEIPQGWTTTSHPAISRQSFDTGPDIVTLGPEEAPPRSSVDAIHHGSPRIRDSPPPPPPRPSTGQARYEPDRLVMNASIPSQYRIVPGTDKIVVTADDMPPRMSLDGRNSSPRLPHSNPHPPPYRIEPPPLPPKTPLPDRERRRISTPMPPYPLDDDEAPPVVNMARKPEYQRR
ncbi:related to calcium-independent phospholipase A2 [Cephalotrichum gorgonifer]|uniref:Related to calcium-independent phospholipase A2 n=1 Tax=Cephalotrichum gorgonifer TaxID=2041049 RepID=A0AAE8MT57_9PEZI|nr:related to calcium-independent phospholipase A2 [Cephalotrichum gorgonifer]